MRRVRILAALLGLGLSAAHAGPRALDGLTLGVPADPVRWAGIVPGNGDGESAGSVLYPAPTAGAFVAGLVAHGILSASARQGRRDAAQEAADAVLEPYAETLATIRQAELIKATSHHLATHTAGTGQGESDKEAVLDYQPTFYLSPDERAMVLDLHITLMQSADEDGPRYRNVVRVVSQPVASENARAWWLEPGTERLRVQAGALLEQALLLALEDMQGALANTNTEQRTVRYLLGSDKLVERAAIIDQHCGWIQLRTLRGELMIVPDMATSHCKD